MFRSLPNELKHEILDFLRPPRVVDGVKQLMEWSTEQKVGRDMLLHCETEDVYERDVDIAITIGFSGDTREVNHIEITLRQPEDKSFEYINIANIDPPNFDPENLIDYMPRQVKDIPSWLRLKLVGAAFLRGLQHLDFNELLTGVEVMDLVHGWVTK